MAEYLVLVHDLVRMSLVLSVALVVTAGSEGDGRAGQRPSGGDE